MPSQNGGDQAVGTAESSIPLPSEHNAPASPAGSNGKAQSPRENNSPSAMSRVVPSQNGDGEVKQPVESPPPQATEDVNAPVSPAVSNGRAQSPKENNSPSAMSRDVPSQNREGEVKESTESPPPPATEQNPPESPSADNGGAQSPKENNSPQPVSRNSPHESEGGQAPNTAASPVQPDKEPSAPSSPVAQDGRSQTPKVNNKPTAVSRNSTQKSGGVQGLESPNPPPAEPAANDTDNAGAEANDENPSLPQKDIDNGVVAPSREGEIAA